MNIKSWRTSLSGVLAILPQVLHFLFPTVITLEVAVGLSSLFVTLGFISAKDKQVTGGTILNSTNDPKVVKESAKTDQP